MALSLRTSYFLIMSLSQSALDNCTDIQFEKSNKSIVPLAIGHNKLYLCHKESIDHLQKILIDSLFLKHFFNKYYMFLGNNIPIFQSYHLPEWNMRRRVYEYLKIHHPEFYVKFRSLTGS
ncbi:conserved hypothetical protein [mine drainage metagenome]|jgi:hypothetical protein|uniref:Uncharacterized protein n=1 Tax=mine drainage metagenome TaxID=410659 RepID=A0A3P3ZRQ2_9ZZZZ